MAGTPWTKDEWKCCLECFTRNVTIHAALTDFWERYPTRTKVAISNKFQHQRISFFSALGSKVSKAKLEEHKQKSVEDVVELDRFKSQISLLKREVDHLRKEAVTSNALTEIIHGMKDATFDSVPSWLSPHSSSSKMTGVPTLLLSDIHFDEYVNPAQIGGVNEYDRAIATRRLHHTFQTAINLCTQHIAKAKYEGFVCALGGDMLSGNIHDELAETNEAPILDSALTLTEILIQGITALEQNFGKVFVPCVVGNHGRLHHKPRMKNRVKDNYEWLIYQFLARHFAGNKNIKFFIPEGSDASYTLYGKNFLLTHGDQFKGGSGISGLISPLMIGLHRKQKRQAQVKNPFDIMMMGHWHSYWHTDSMIINGCFPPGSEVTLADGTRAPIEKIQVGDLVITHANRIRPVVDTMVRPHSGNLLNIRVGTDQQKFQCTPNHPVWAVKANQVGQQISMGGGWEKSDDFITPAWVPAEYLGEGDYIQVGFSSEVENGDEITPEFARLLGIYMAEGSVSGSDKKLQHLDFSLHGKESEYADFLVQESNARWGSGSHVFPKGEGRENSRSVAVYRTAAAEEMHDLAGKGSDSKQLKPSLMKLPPALQWQILRGWLEGDGSVSKQSYRGDRLVSGSSVSYSMICQLQQIALRNGLNPTLYRLLPGEGGRRERISYTLGFTGGDAQRLSTLMDETYSPGSRDVEWKTIWVEGHPFTRITDIWREAYEGPVHNITVQEDHSYTVQGFSVKNSVKGYDEYAAQNNFSFEDPQQALFITNPSGIITFRMPVQCNPFPKSNGSPGLWTP